MASSIHEEDQLGKAFDTAIMRRLLRYVRPYTSLVVLSIVLMLMGTAANLIRPYLIERAIDQHMIALTKPMVVFTHQQPPSGVAYVSFQGQTYVRVGLLNQSQTTRFSQLPEAQLVHDGSWYLVQGPQSAFPLPNGGHIVQSGHQATVQGRDRTTLSAIPVSKSGIQRFQAQDEHGIIQLGIWYLGAIVAAYLVTLIQTVVMGYAVQRVINDLRGELFRHLQRLNLAFFDRNPVGRLVTRVMNDCQTINDMFANVMLSFFQDIFTLVGIVFVLFHMSASLALVSLVVLPLVAVSTALYRKYARTAFREVRVKLARINASLAENIAGMRIIHMFQRQDQVYQRFFGINHDYLKSSLRELLTFAIFRPSMDFIYYLALALVLWYGGLHVLSGVLQFGVLYAFTNYVQQFFQPINDLSEKYNLVQQAMASSERVFELLDNTEILPEFSTAITSTDHSGSIQFDHVWFAYIDEEWVLRDVSFTVEPGQTVAFVGATGAGKSSILSLLSRFYDVQQGRILVDGKDVREWPLDALRKRIGVVLQDVFLFSGTIADNIRLGRTDIDDARVEEVIQAVHASPFVHRLTDGIQHRVQERGSTFSAGERQLIAFARALAFDPGILVLDEATAYIDTETEQWIQGALETVTKGRTTLVVAHRLSTIQHADNIIVLHKGRIREMGRHQELLKRGGFYYNLYRLQYQNSSAETVL